MNAAHLHLLITHVPTMGALFGIGVLILAWFRRSEELKQTSLLFFLLAGAAAIPAYLTGAPAHDIVVKMPIPISRDMIDRHAEVAVLATVAALVLAGVALGGCAVWRRGKRLPAWFLVLTLLLALIASALMAWTADLGGKIRHPEIHTLGGTGGDQHVLCGLFLLSSLPLAVASFTLCPHLKHIDKHEHSEATKWVGGQTGWAAPHQRRRRAWLPRLRRRTPRTRIVWRFVTPPFPARCRCSWRGHGNAGHGRKQDSGRECETVAGRATVPERRSLACATHPGL
jgi:hypothetical protein